MKNFIKPILIIALCTLLTSCAAKRQVSFSPENTTAKFKSGSYVNKVDNFLLIFDSSSSMFENYRGRPKLDLAKETANNLNQTIPDINLQAGLRVFGPFIKPYGMTKYNKGDFSGALYQVRNSSGNSPLEKAIDGAAEQLSSSPGKTALIILSDGVDMTDLPFKSAAKIKNRYGDRICVYTIQIGDAAEGKALLSKVAQIGECGFSGNADQLKTGAGMGQFVEKVFFEKDKDSDGDGVFDSHDKCPNTRHGVVVDLDGCEVKKSPVDSDYDGVIDSIDRCPNTPRGTRVDNYGCPIPVKTKAGKAELRVLFDFDKAVVKTSDHGHLKAFADFLKSDPKSVAEIEGHTDNWGSEKYNLDLSQRRANAVRQYLINRFGVNPSQLKTKGWGFTRPAATNKSQEGRKQNRRAVSTIMRY